MKDILYSDKEIAESRREALTQICKYLSAEEVDGQFANRSGDYYSKDKFIVTWKGNYLGFPAEFGIHKTEAFFADYSGHKAIYANVGLFHERQLDAYHSIHRALIEVGLKLCTNKNEKKEFFHKYVNPYNEKLKL